LRTSTGRVDVPSVETTRYVRMVDEWNQLVVWPTLEVSVSFTQVYVDLYGVLDSRHCRSLSIESALVDESEALQLEYEVFCVVSRICDQMRMQ
jgi:hypothetical protein